MAKKNLRHLKGALENHVNNSIEKSGKRVKKVALEAITYLAYNTPVDTSKALSNWVVGYGEPARVIFEPHIPGKGGSTKEQSASATVALNAKLLERRRKPGEKIYISNSLPYIKRLNAGHSPQNKLFWEVALLMIRKGLGVRGR